MIVHGCKVKRQFYKFEHQDNGSFSPVGGSGLGVYGNSYQGAATNRRETNSWNPAITDADSASIPDLARLRARSRDAVRNQPLAGGAISTTVTNVVGSGLVPQPTIDHEYIGMTPEQAEEWQNHTEREFSLWAESKNCSLNRALNFYGLQELAFRSTMENGDIFANTPRKATKDDWPYKLRIQLIEADRVCNPSFGFDSPSRIAGVDKDEDGAPIAYNVLRQHPGNWLYVTGKSWQWDRLEAWNNETGFQNVVHLYRVLRADQTRGIPMLAPVIEPLKMLGRYQEHVLMAAAVSALFTVFIKSQGAQGMQHMSPAGGPQVVTQQYPVADGSSDLRLGSGNVLELMPGEEVEFADPKQPGSQFDPFFLAIVRQIGVGLEIPFEILIKHYTASYSAARAAMLDAWKFFLSRRTWLADNFCQPLYEIWLAEAVAMGRISAPGFFADPMIRKAYSGALWNGPGKGMINEKEESLAMEKRIELGVTTAEEETQAYNGTSWAAKQSRRVKERKMREESGLPMPGAKVTESGTAPSEEPDNSSKEAA